VEDDEFKQKEGFKMKNKMQLLCVITAVVLYVSGLSMLVMHVSDTLWTVTVQLDEIVEGMEPLL
jgi:hypothetical protein